MAKEVKTLKLKIKQCESNLDRIEKYVQTLRDRHVTGTEFFEVKARFERLPPIFEQFEATQNEIEILTKFGDSEVEFRQQFEAKYYSIHAQMEEFMTNFKPKSNSPSERNNTVLPPTPIQLPLMNMPQFNGEYHLWPEFRDSFSALIGNNDSLSNIQKFHHLRSCLGKNVLETIQAIPVTNDNFELALNQLKNRYEREHLMASNHVNSILTFPKLFKESSSDLRKLHNCLNNNLQALKQLNVPVDYWDLILIHIVSSKLDSTTRGEWEKLSINQNQIKLKDLLNLINYRADILERLEANKMLSKQNPQEKKPNISVNRFTASVNVQSSVLQCRFCDGSHPIFRCISFLKLCPQERVKTIKEKGLCINCLRGSHKVSQCSSSKCRSCGKPHNTLLHIERENKEATQPKQEKIQESTTVATTQFNSKTTGGRHNQVLLPTAIVLISDKDNRWHRCRALLDTGAMCNFISAEMHKKLNLPTENIQCSVKGVGSAAQNVQQQTTVEFSPSNTKKIRFKATCLILEAITSNIPLISFDQDLNLPNKMFLADPTFNISGKIDLLLGSSMVWDLLKTGRMRVPHTQLMLQETKLGWIVGGQRFSPHRGTLNSNQKIACTAINETALADQVKKFWEIEEVGQKPILSPDDQNCEKSFVETHSRDKQGRFIVRIPFKPNVKQLGQSRQSARKRFKYLEKRLNKNPTLHEEYIKIMREYLSMGHMKRVHDEDDCERASYYIPHHAVVRQESLTTKIRVVFDASMSTTSGLSLNDVQHIGPTIQNDLFSILINFRLHKYVMCSDISKMYRMVWLHDEHKPFHRIFWRENPSDTLRCYELQTVTFGTASAPFLAIRCLHQLADENSRKFPKTSEIIKTNFYVDDLIYGTDSLEELLQIQHEVTSILASAGFYLRKWLCNDTQVYNQLKLNPKLDCNTLQFGDKDHKTLGISWNTESDNIIYSNYQLGGHPITKRTVLSELSKIFDPLGLLGPILIVGKLLVQEMWQQKISWDEPLTAELSDRWSNFREEINNIRLLTVDRKVTINNYHTFEIHGFCDASQKAYGACIFIRSQDEQGNISTKLLCSKSRVAPLKTISLPRLELCAALLLSRLVKKVVDKIEVQPKSIYYWSDSTITLSWIRGDPSRWKTFVSNRVSEIQQLTEIKGWCHISSKENPADILSRGITINGLVKCELWWSGPTFLANKSIQFESGVEVLGEIPEQRIAAHVVSEVDQPFNLLSRYSSFEKLKRTTAYCLRFATNCKSRPESRKLSELSVDELAVSEKALVRLMQKQSFPKEYTSLQSSQPLEKTSRLLALNPFMDKENLIRVGGRLDKTKLAFESKHPLILAAGHNLTKLIVQQIHEKNFHCGPAALLAFARQNYWPIDGRNLVRGIVRKCKICFMARPKACQYLMGQLPECRASQNFPFQNVGIDYAGPILIKDRKTRNHKTLKAYVCVFVCMTTKAIHLECVSDLSTEAFILCLKRFIGRRGKPANIYSDNAKNFVGANSEIKRLCHHVRQNFHEINKYLSNEQIQWHFIPPRTPSFGGIWEAGVKGVKSHLNKVTKNIKFDFEQLTTLLCQIEGLLNSRPLTPLSSDPSDLTPLTPGHFLIGRPINQHPEISHPSLIPISRLKQYRQLETVLDHFWKRWSGEYVHQLQVRIKWTRQNQDGNRIQVGKLVLVKESTSPFQWPLGRITELHPGSDGVTRVVSLKVRDGIIKRGVTQICVLPEDT